MPHRDLPQAARQIADQQGWNLDTLSTHLIGFIASEGPVMWDDRLFVYFKQIARAENRAGTE